MVKPAEKRRAVDWLRGKTMSQRRACGLVGLHRSTYGYESRREEPVELKKQLKTHAQERPRWGYRRLFILLIRDGFKIGISALYRIYRAMGLAIRKRKRRRLKGQGRVPKEPATKPNERWSMDFVHDSTAHGQAFRALNVVDDFTREALVIEVAGSLPSERVIRSLESAFREHGKPEAIVHDNGPEFVSNKILWWAHQQGVRLCPIDPGKPTQNPFVESFNGRYRDECLNQHWFASVQEAAEISEDWRIDYNTIRPHSALSSLTPEEYRQRFEEGRPHGPDLPVTRNLENPVPTLA